MSRSVRIILIVFTVLVSGAAVYIHWWPEPYPTVNIKVRLNTPMPEKPADQDYSGHKR